MFDSCESLVRNLRVKIQLMLDSGNQGRNDNNAVRKLIII